MVRAVGRISLQDCVLLLVAYALSLGFVWHYVSLETQLYFWDQRGYQDRTFELATAFQASPLHGLADLVLSLSRDYNMLPCVPLLPFVWLLGTSRLVYVAAITAVYTVPLALVVGGVATRLFEPSLPKRPVFWTAVTATLLLPPTWTAALRGMPDAGGGVLLAAALLVHLGDPVLARWRSIVRLGLLIGGAVLFRRHFAYPGTALLVAIAADVAGATRTGMRLRPWTALPRLLRAGLVGLVATATVFAVAPAFAWRALTTDYSDFYASYREPVADVLVFFAGSYGAIVAALALLGLLAASALDVARRRPARLLLIFGGVFLAIWLAGPRQGQWQYTFGSTIVVALGLVALFWTILLRARRWRTALATLLAGLIGLNAAHGSGLLPLADENALWLARAYPPQTRSDRPAVDALLAELERVAHGRKVLVAASSKRLNPDLVRGAVAQLPAGDPRRLEVVRSPEIDSSGRYPLQALLTADIVVVAVPAQLHLLPGEQDVVRTVVDQFVQGWGVARDFARLPGSFELAGGVRVLLFERRAAPSLAGALRALEEIRADVGGPPGAEPYWLGLGAGGTVRVAGGGPESLRLEADLAQGPVTFVHFGPPARGGVILSALIDARDCRSAHAIVLRAKPVDERGGVAGEEVTIGLPEPRARVRMPLAPKGAAYLTLRVERRDEAATEAGPCPLVVWQPTLASGGRPGGEAERGPLLPVPGEAGPARIGH
ncbi:hypothetical protein [Benzoatithermus flavus]|uniref:Glycosyltransferase RgtA/B/C/D-like domain-containing protein n=1 Tax=Benzoatithermus flavus TaxID=3108223 RepID=A0ABU8XZH5_9PROT